MEYNSRFVQEQAFVSFSGLLSCTKLDPTLYSRWRSLRINPCKPWATNLILCQQTCIYVRIFLSFYLHPAAKGASAAGGFSFAAAPTAGTFPLFHAALAVFIRDRLNTCIILRMPRLHTKKAAIPTARGTYIVEGQ